MKTRLTELLGIDHPIMLAGMGGVSYSVLAAAVSNAGGYGCLGASTMSSAELAGEIAATRALTSKPFGVDLLTAFPDSLVANVRLLIDGGASTFVAGLGVPEHVIELCHDHNVLVISMCGKVEHARRALDGWL
jgi:enoyl-[acyl-carrier protein] reductase II